MAYPEAVAPSIPETLPEDFNDWDGEASPVSLPGNSREAEPSPVLIETPTPLEQSMYRDAVRASFPGVERHWGAGPAEPVSDKQQNGSANWQREAPAAFVPRNANEARAVYVLRENPELSGQSVERGAMLSPVSDRPRDSRTASVATMATKPQKLTSEYADELPSHAASSVDDSDTAHEVAVQPRRPDPAVVDEARNVNEVAAARMREADEAIYQLFSTNTVEAEPEPKSSRNKWVIAAAVGACSILLSFALTMALGHHGAKAAVDQPVQPAPESTGTLPKASLPKSPAGKSLTEDKARAESQQTASDQPLQQEQAANPAHALTETQTQMMNDQLAAPRAIPRDAAKQVSEVAPPPVSLGTASADNASVRGAIPNVFNNGNAKTVVQALPAKPLVISSGIAVGMLIKKLPPVYPQIARSARVSGTVVLQATISKYGTIQNLQVVSGPEMLRQSALDAVRTWRYKPYMLNNEPTDAETTISVVFSLGS